MGGLYKLGAAQIGYWREKKQQEKVKLGHSYVPSLQLGHPSLYESPRWVNEAGTTELLWVLGFPIHKRKYDDYTVKFQAVIKEL